MNYNPRSNDSCFLWMLVLIGVAGFALVVVGMMGIYLVSEWLTKLTP